MNVKGNCGIKVDCEELCHRSLMNIKGNYDIKVDLCNTQNLEKVA